MTALAPLGDRALRFARPAGVPAAALVRAVKAWPGVIDVVVARADVAAYFAERPAVDEAWLAALADLGADAAPPPRTHTLAARYDGEDLEAVARALDATIADVVALHAGATYTVDTIGFAPGFAYLVGLEPRLHLPRRATPRPRVPAGSLAIAGGFTAVYPFDSPGGWHLLGHVAGATLFGPGGALLQLGDRVRFVP